MRVIITGQRWFGAEVFRLCEGLGLDVVAVSAPADDRLCDIAQFAGIPVLSLGAALPQTDLIIAAHTHEFISDRVRSLAGLGVIGFHPSLLPMHRGRDAIRWAIHMRERITGGSVYWLTDVVDGGPVAAQDWCFIRPDDTAESLWRRELAPMGLRLLSRVLQEIICGTLTRVPQDEALASWEPSWQRPPLSTAKAS